MSATEVILQVCLWCQRLERPKRGKLSARNYSQSTGHKALCQLVPTTGESEGVYVTKPD